MSKEMTENLKEDEKEKGAEKEAEKEALSETKPKKKKTALPYVIAIIVLAAVIVGLLVAILSGGKKDKGTNSGTSEEISTEGVATPGDTASVSEESQTEEEKAVTTQCYVEISKASGWENNGKYAAQYDVYIYNNSSQDISDWEVRITGCQGAVLEGNWNGTFNLSGDVLSITAVDYNGTIGAKQNVNFGFIMDLDTEAATESILSNARLYVNGEEYTAAPEEATEAATEAATEKATEASEPAKAESGTPLDNHGALSVSGTDLVDKNGNKYQLKGVSTHGLSWFPEYVNKDAFQTFRDDWGANLVRLAMYTAESGGYCTGGDQEKLKQVVDNGVNYATELGMYVIIDWHILSDGNPQTNKTEAISFFKEMSGKYKNYDNVLYEICNEPNGGATWADIKSYAEEVIPVIRANDPDAIIIVGTPTWSQDADVAAEDPITGYDNIMYTVHFYAATHTDSIRNKVTTARNKGLAIFISEFSICDASGNGSIDYDQAEKWMDLISEYNLSYAGWNVSNKNETSSLIKSSCTKTSGWTDDDLSETGLWLKQQIKGQ